MAAKGMGGVSTAVCTDTMAGASNLAKMSWAGTRLDIGADLFSPQRSIDRVGNAFGLNGAVKSGSTWFAVPEAGFSYALSPNGHGNATPGP
jgi:long-chain fatty acid transport protein